MYLPQRRAAALRGCWIFLACALAVACDSTSPAPAPASLTLAPDTATLAPGATVQLHAIPKSASGVALPEATDVRWASSDPSLATVSATGLLTGVAPGAATITATRGTLTAQAGVTVKQGIISVGFAIGDLVADPSLGTLLAVAINDAGQILASGTGAVMLLTPPATTPRAPAGAERRPRRGDVAGVTAARAIAAGAWQSSASRPPP